MDPGGCKENKGVVATCKLVCYWYAVNLVSASPPINVRNAEKRPVSTAPCVKNGKVPKLELIHMKSEISR